MRNPQGSPADFPGVSTRGRVSRRAFIGAAGAAGIVAATSRMLPASAAARPARCFFGSNADVFVAIQRGELIPGTSLHSRPVPGLRGVRMYGKSPGRGGNRLAPRWPAGPSPESQGPIVYSIYPILDTVIKSDRATIKEIQHIIDTAPPNSYLNAWHEALSLRSSTPPDATPARMKLLHTRLNKMCQESANVRYGSIFGSDCNFLDHRGMPPPAACPPGAGKPHVWDSVPDDLGFYGMDPYGGNDIGKNMCFLDTFIANARLKAASRYPKILIAETNNKSTSAHRVTWFEEVARRMHTYGSNAIGILTFWRDGKAPLSGPWNPADTTVINGINHVIEHILR